MTGPIGHAWGAASRTRTRLTPRSRPRTSQRLLVVDGPLRISAFEGLLARLLADGVELVVTSPHLHHAHRDPRPPALCRHPRMSVLPVDFGRGTREQIAGNLHHTVATLAWLSTPSMAGATRARERALGWIRTYAVTALRMSADPSEARLADAIEAGAPLDLFSGASMTEATLFNRLFREIDRLIAPPIDLVRTLERERIDGVLMLSRCSFGGVEAPVVRAARLVGIPSGMLIFSWDNLTSKGVLLDHPDALFVWNEIQAREAIDLHGAPPESLHVVGAANFDPFFEEVNALRARSDPHGNQPVRLLYLASSPNICADEPEVADRWAASVRSSGDPRVRGAEIVVRAHPAREKRWRKWTPAQPGVTVELPEGGRSLAETLLESDAVVALNTSAELEAAIVGRPVFTFRTDEARGGQDGSMHFRYLLAGEGGFVTDSPSLDDHVRALSRALSPGVERPSSGFIEAFVRPHGFERPVSPLLAERVSTLLLGRA